ncbi:hypothetical protein [Paracoccus aerodenitrificans]|uniref:hypothetical protein n=1 Tax=Paracoccus aerodenitrificans TaxID=3017781 RepID=UPI0022F0EA34|nr:hypothetical protein [Paracoccus aerodenitrificans]WBU64338.1 hypothetical protein PAE61_02500 [Paracoccus aerodenitrificans]
MTVNIRYRLILILEVLLWLGAVAGVAVYAMRAWAVREEGMRAMIGIAGPGLLAVGAAVIALLVLIGIYHNTRRNAEATERLARQGAGGVRRLPGSARAEVSAQASRISAQTAPEAVSDTPPHFAPAPKLQTAPVGGSRRLGPAS